MKHAIKITTAKTFGRLGTWANVEQKMIEARSAGVRVIHDQEAGTVEATYERELVFRAIDKGSGEWIVIYSTKFYPQE